jgi:hypothetical protein
MFKVWRFILETLSIRKSRIRKQISIIPYTHEDATQAKQTAVRNIDVLKETPTTHLDLYIKHCVRINLQSKSSLHMASEAFLVALLDLRPLGTERLVLDKLEKTLELGEVLEPRALTELQRR